jgi:hypothetical protein
MLPPSTSTDPVRVRPGLVDLGQLEAIVGTRPGAMSLVIPGRIPRSGAEPGRVHHRAGDGVRSLLQSDDGTHRRIVVLLPPARLTSFPGKVHQLAAVLSQLLELTYAQVSIGMTVAPCELCRQDAGCGCQPNFRLSAPTEPVQYSGLASDPTAGDDG